MDLSFFKYLPYIQCFWNKKKLFEVTFFVTNRCNFKCPFCFNDDKSPEMTIEQITEVSKSLPSFFRLLISGGEPFIRKDIAEICQIFIDNNNVKHISIATNGFYTNNIAWHVGGIARRNSDVMINVSLSLDSLHSTRDNLVGVPLSFNNLLGTYYCLFGIKKYYKNLSVGTITTQCKENEHKLYEIYKYATEDLQVDNFGFNIARGTDASLDRYKSFTNFLLRQYKSKMKFPFLRAKCKLIYDTIANKKEFKCYAGKQRKVIGADGMISPCETIKFGGNCSNCYHECDIAVSQVFNWRNLWKLFVYR